MGNFLYPPFIPIFGVGAPGALVPHNTLYYDTSTNPYTSYVYMAGAWHACGALGAGVNASALRGTNIAVAAPNPGDVLTMVAGSWTPAPGGGGGGSPDFNIPLAASFPTILNGGVLTDALTGLGVASPGTAGGNLFGAVRAMSAANHTVFSRVIQGQCNDFDSFAGICVGESVSGKLIALSIKNRSSISVDQWTTPVAHAGGVASYGNSGGTSAVWWLNIAYTLVGNILDFSISMDGVNFTSIYTDNVYLAVPDQLGVMVAGQGVGRVSLGSITAWNEV